MRISAHWSSGAAPSAPAYPGSRTTAGGTRRTAVGWARLWTIANPRHAAGLRRGAWYPVVEDQLASNVTVEVGPRAVPVARHLLEFRRHQPDRFTVVYRPRGEHNPVAGTPRDVGDPYAVCPNCAERQPLGARWEQLECLACRHSGVVAWWETG